MLFYCMEMGSGSWMIIAWLMLLQMKGGLGIRFVLVKEECLSHNVEYEGDSLHISFVVIPTDSSRHYADADVDLLIKGPSGDNIHEFHDKTSGKHQFLVHTRGLYRFCFNNKSPYHVTIDFDVHAGHFKYHEKLANSEHFNPLLEQISKLEEALSNILFEQHWLEAQTDRQALVNESMSQRAKYKAILESLALIGASSLQIFLLQRLFERKLGTSRV